MNNHASYNASPIYVVACEIESPGGETPFVHYELVRPAGRIDILIDELPIHHDEFAFIATGNYTARVGDHPVDDAVRAMRLGPFIKERGLQIRPFRIPVDHLRDEFPDLELTPDRLVKFTFSPFRD